MSAYLSYFSSNSSSAPQQQQRPSTPSSTWSSAFTARISSLRKALTKDSEEDDPDNEDCSHVSNVLRAYYTEKGRSFPEWLPPDPKKPTPVAAQPQSQYSSYGNQYGGYGGSQYAAPPAHARGGSSGRGGLSDLWEPSQTNVAPPVAQSLRSQRPTPQALRQQDSGRSNLSGISQESYTSQSSVTSRPLPSQRTGSLQNAQNAPTPGIGSRDRLRARLQGTDRSSSPLRTNETTQDYSGDSYPTAGTNASNSTPYMSASQPWSSGGSDYFGRSGYSNPAAGSTPVPNAQRYRPGGPR